MRFAALQSEAGQEFLRSQGMDTDSFESLVFVSDWDRRDQAKFDLRTTGVLRVCAELGGPWRIVSWLTIVPEWLRDPCYRLVANTRYSLFGEYKPTPFADPEWSKRFL